MTNNQVDPNQDPNQLPEEELEQVSGGGIPEIVGEAVEGIKETSQAVVDTAIDVGDALF